MGDSGHLFWTDFSLYWLQILFNHLHQFKKCCTNLKRFAEKYVYIPPLVFIHLSCHLFIRICFSKVCILCQHTGFVMCVTKFWGGNSIDFNMLMHPRFFYMVVNVPRLIHLLRISMDQIIHLLLKRQSFLYLLSDLERSWMEIWLQFGHCYLSLHFKPFAWFF